MSMNMSKDNDNKLQKGFNAYKPGKLEEYLNQNDLFKWHNFSIYMDSLGFCGDYHLKYDNITKDMFHSYDIIDLGNYTLSMYNRLIEDISNSEKQEKKYSLLKDALHVLIGKINQYNERLGKIKNKYNNVNTKIENNILLIKCDNKYDELIDFNHYICMKDMDDLLEENFKLQEYVELPKYYGIWSPKLKIIECELEIANVKKTNYTRNRMLYVDQKKPNIINNSKHKIYLTLCSDVFLKITKFQKHNIIQDDNENCEVIMISNIDVKDINEAQSLLETISNSYFFQLRKARNINFFLEFRKDHNEYKKKLIRPFISRNDLKDVDINLDNCYNKEALYMFMFAQKKETPAFFRYILLYQVIEFYFSSANITTKKSERDRIIELFEKIDATAFENFVKKYSFGNTKANELAKIIYDIRCKIVHNKSRNENYFPAYPDEKEIGKYLDFLNDIDIFLIEKYHLI